MNWTAVRRWCADTLAMIILSTLVGLMIEIGVAHYTVAESVRIRLGAMLPNVLTAWLNGRLVDGIRSWYRVTPQKHGRQALADLISFTIFQIPLYIIIQVLATWPTPDLLKIVSSCGTVLIASLFIGAPYGILLNLCRAMFRVADRKL